MQASAKNGFQNTSISDCSGTPYNFQPEYNTAAKGNIIPWAALQTNISTQFETGHWEPCTQRDRPRRIRRSQVGLRDTYYNTCNGPYESGPENKSEEPSDAFCYPAG